MSFDLVVAFREQPEGVEDFLQGRGFDYMGPMQGVFNSWERYLFYRSGENETGVAADVMDKVYDSTKKRLGDSVVAEVDLKAWRGRNDDDMRVLEDTARALATHYNAILLDPRTEEIQE